MTSIYKKTKKKKNNPGMLAAEKRKAAGCWIIFWKLETVGLHQM